MAKFPFVTRVCPVCGKKFIPAVFHQYRVRKRLVCSYGCERKAKIRGDRNGTREKFRK